MVASLVRSPRRKLKASIPPPGQKNNASGKACINEDAQEGVMRMNVVVWVLAAICVIEQPVGIRTSAEQGPVRKHIETGRGGFKPNRYGIAKEPLGPGIPKPNGKNRSG